MLGFEVNDVELSLLNLKSDFDIIGDGRMGQDPVIGSLRVS